MFNQALAFRGRIQGLVSRATLTAFVTSHPEQQATALYRLDTSAERASLSADPLSCYATALTAIQDTLWLAGSDGQLYSCALHHGKPKALTGLQLGQTPVLALVAVAGARLAVLQAQRLSLVDTHSGNITQQLPYDTAATTLAASPDGSCLAVGNSQGVVMVYHAETAEHAFILGSQGQIHQGQVTALSFAEHDLQFYSAGTDKKLLLTHARGTLQPLDKGRNSNHEQTITTILVGKQRLFTGALDKSIKAWPYAGGQPLSLKQGLADVAGLSFIQYQDKSALLVACRDSTLRLVELVEDERPVEVKLLLENGYTLARQLLQSREPKQREKALHLLADYADKPAFDLIAKQFNQETDRAISEQMVAVGQQSLHPQATELLETLLKTPKHDSVRTLAFNALIARTTASDLRPYQLALDSGFVDSGKLALKALAKLAPNQVAAKQLLLSAFQHKQAPLRLYALSLVEGLFASDSPRASLLALQSPYTDLSRAALIRLYQRQLLKNSEVRHALLLAQAHEEADLRHTAFLVTILSQPALTQALKNLEPDLGRQLQELEDFELLAPNAPANKSSKTRSNTISEIAKRKLINGLDFDDYNVLLQGMSNRYADIGLMAALGLAILQDQRAFGLLLVLSQEADQTIRVGVSRAFACLGQADSIPTLALLLNDSAPEVRDAAFSALHSLQAQPLLSAQYGFNSSFADIHARSLKLLLDQFAANPTPAEQTQALDLLKAALNDPFPAIRQEAYKACLNRQLGGNAADTLHLLLSSQFENLHQEVLNELMANSKVLPALDWVEPLLLTLFDDVFAAIRLQALGFALQENKRFSETNVLAQAVKSIQVDVRKAALQHIQQHASVANQLHLSALLADENTEIRTSALAALIQGKPSPAVLHALSSPYDDIQVSAANALASWGEVKAYEVLISLLQRPQPSSKAEQVHWLEISVLALQGLESLGDSRAFETVVGFMRHEQQRLVKQAAQALPWVSDSSHQATLLVLQQDERPVVRAYAKIALAFLKNTQANALLADSALMDTQIDRYLQLAATLCLNEITAVTLQRYLLDTKTERAALLVLASFELLLHADAPYLSTRALSIQQPQVQLFCAGLLVHYQTPTRRWEYVCHWLNDLQTPPGSKDKWAISQTNLAQLASVLVYGQASVRAHLLLDVIAPLANHITPKAWELKYSAFVERYVTLLPETSQALKPSVATQAQQALWNQQAFGAYLGLIRQDNQSTRQQTLGLRLKALHSLHELALADDTMRSSVMSSLLTLLNHPQVEIRQGAFDALQALGMPATQLGHAATYSPQSDIARQGLQLLMAHSTPSQADHLLQTLIQSDSDLLAREAYQLYSQRKGAIALAPIVLQAQNPALREQMIGELAAHYAQADAQQCLIQATFNDQFAIARLAAWQLAVHQHPQAVEVLTRLFDNSQQDEQRLALIPALKKVSDKKIAEYLVAYSQRSILKAELRQRLYEVIADYRHPTVFAALLARLAAYPSEANALIKTLLTISGYDQAIVDYEEVKADQSWLTQQYPRHDALLIELFSTLIRLHYPAKAAELAYAMGWVKAKAADQALLVAISVLSDAHLLPVVQAIAHRVAKRQGRAAGLIQVLHHANPDIQFLAAEGLANTGHPQGFSILMAAVDYQTNADYRQRAVLALGKSGDERALDKLLKLAEDKEHFLQAVAAEALGHMGKSAQAERIFKLLKSQLQQAPIYADANAHLLKGLRWLNTLSAWQLIDEFILNPQHFASYRELAIDLLQYRATPAARELLLQLLRGNERYSVVNAAYNTAKRLWQDAPNTVSEVDYALLHSVHVTIDPTLLERISRYAPTTHLLQLIAADYPLLDAKRLQHILNTLGAALLSRYDYAVADLLPLLSNAKPSAVAMAARLLGRDTHLTQDTQNALEAALKHAYTRWQQAYRYTTFYSPHDPSAQAELEGLEAALLQVVWSATYHECFTDLIHELLTTTRKAERFLQQHILTALLAKDKLNTKPILTTLTHLQTSEALPISTLANQVLAKHAPQAAVDWQRLLNNRALLLTPPFAQALTQAAGQAAYQAQVLPLLIAKQAVSTLVQIASNEQQLETVRLGALEGLARIHTLQAQAALQTLQQNIQDKDMARAAFRALRRLQRSLKAAPAAGVNA